MGVCSSSRNANNRAGNFVVPQRIESFPQPRTREQLYKYRREFWETRTTNNIPTWLELQRVLELMNDGERATAEMILRASEMTPFADHPSKKMKYSFDSQGRRYDIPLYIFEDPSDLLDDVEPKDLDIDITAVSTWKFRPSSGSDFEIDAPASRKILELKAEITELLKFDPDEKKLYLVYQGKVLEDHWNLVRPVQVLAVVQVFIVKMKLTE